MRKSVLIPLLVLSLFSLFSLLTFSASAKTKKSNAPAISEETVETVVADILAKKEKYVFHKGYIAQVVKKGHFVVSIKFPFNPEKRAQKVHISRYKYFTHKIRLADPEKGKEMTSSIRKKKKWHETKSILVSERHSLIKDDLEQDSVTGDYSYKYRIVFSRNVSSTNFLQATYRFAGRQFFGFDFFGYSLPH